MSPTAMITIRIPDWDKYNAKSKEYDEPTWFRMSNDLPTILLGKGIRDPRAGWLYTCLLCLASKLNNGTVQMNIQGLCTYTGLNMQALFRLNNVLFRSQLIEITEGEILHTNKQTDEQTNKHERPPVFNLEVIYQRYPRKLGKTLGIQRLRKQITTPQEYRELENAMERFIAHHKAKATPEEFIPYFATWVSSWRDWIDPTTGTADTESADPFSFFDKINNGGVA